MYIRKLLILQDVPIRYFESAPGREVAAIMYENMSEAADASQVYSEFVRKVELLAELQPQVVTSIPSNNRFLYEVLYWCLSILEKEDVDTSRILDRELVADLANHVRRNSDVYDSDTLVFRADTIARFERTSDFFSERFDLDLSNLYVDNNGRVSVNQYRESARPIDRIEDINDMRLNKPDAQSITVENLYSKMKARRRFLVRPSYQRYESITRVKASALIESMLLGIMLPPIFVFEREDGVTEVVDGQQRILCILGFMGLGFIDERENRVQSKKHGFKLSRLKILSELDGKSFADLDMHVQDKLWDFSLYQVSIRERINKKFDPVDLFIRLNIKPYPIRDNTFELWNSFADRSTIQSIKDITLSSSHWFYLRVDNRRMDNENLITTLAYLEYYDKRGKLDDVLQFYPQGSSILSRVTSKTDITRVLERVSESEEERTEFASAIRAVKSFRRKVRTMLIDRDIKGDEDKWLEGELSNLLGTKNRRTYNQFYVLWYALRTVNHAMIIEHRQLLKDEICQLMMFIRNTDYVDENLALNFFYELVKRIVSDHKPAKLRLKLTKTEISKRIIAQDNRCPICGFELFIGEDVEMDHIYPISVGGSDTLENIQIVHWICNRRKGNTVA